MNLLLNSSSLSFDTEPRCLVFAGFANLLGGSVVKVSIVLIIQKLTSVMLHC